MPSFYKNRIVTSQEMRVTIDKIKSMSNNDKPIGIIGESGSVQYGFDGNSYFVSIGILGELAFGRMEMTMHQAKAVYDAILFFDIDVEDWNFELSKSVLKQARKMNLSDDDLMFFFGDLLEQVNTNQ